MSSITAVWLPVLLFLSATPALAQSGWRISTDDAELSRKWTDKRFSTTTARTAAVESIYQSLISDGFLNAEIDTLGQDSTLHCSVRKGEQFVLRSMQWVNKDNLQTDWRRLINAPKSDVLGPSTLADRTEPALRYLENHGYPFARVHIDSLSGSPEAFTAFCSVYPGPKITLDSLILKSESKLPYAYIRNYIHFKPNAAYNESEVMQLEKKLREIPFVQVRKVPEVLFKTDKASIFIYLEKKKANYFNGVLGIRPNDITGKVNLTGDVEVKLLSALNSGEEIYLNWRRLQPQTQDLNAKLAIPFLFKLPIGTEGQIKIYRRDSTFASTKSSFALLFQLGGGQNLRASVERNNHSQLGAVTAASNLANVNTTLYGLGINLLQYDYRFNPRRGFGATADASAGKRAVQANSSDLTSSTRNTPVYKLEGSADVYLPTWTRQCMRMGVQGGGYFTDKIYDNEMFRIGGLRTLRGISEETIFATSWSTATLEYRYLFEENSALYLFVDQSWYEKKGVGTFITDTPIGFGAGLNFQTNSGIFTFNYALGQQFDNPMLVRNAKISFGFRNIF